MLRYATWRELAPLHCFVLKLVVGTVGLTGVGHPPLRCNYVQRPALARRMPAACESAVSMRVTISVRARQVSYMSISPCPSKARLSRGKEICCFRRMYHSLTAIMAQTVCGSRCGCELVEGGGSSPRSVLRRGRVSWHLRWFKAKWPNVSRRREHWL